MELERSASSGNVYRIHTEQEAASTGESRYSKQSSIQGGRNAWSNDESTVLRLSTKPYYKTRVKELPEPSSFELPEPFSFDDDTTLDMRTTLLDFHSFSVSLSDIMSKFNTCAATGVEGKEADTSLLRDEDFFWPSNAQSYETCDTRFRNDEDVQAPQNRHFSVSNYSLVQAADQDDRNRMLEPTQRRDSFRYL